MLRRGFAAQGAGALEGRCPGGSFFFLGGVMGGNIECSMFGIFGICFGPVWFVCFIFWFFRSRFCYYSLGPGF